MQKLICTDVIRQAWNDEKLTFENDDFKVIVHIKNPEYHGKFVKDSELENLIIVDTNKADELEKLLREERQKVELLEQNIAEMTEAAKPKITSSLDEPNVVTGSESTVTATLDTVTEHSITEHAEETKPVSKAKPRRKR